MPCRMQWRKQPVLLPDLHSPLIGNPLFNVAADTGPVIMPVMVKGQPRERPLRIFSKMYAEGVQYKRDFTQ